eukprot:TRINITY_DN19929_c0_g1_i1.p1 TRINITY_DN19929_c0_g1~~TRINITY_DN19929_c0_g1_i1.p1  ORF type:complete len:223 (-),score=37.15 TRINITY_DN19929_c0_g1_i1:16-684(-)
MLRTITRFSQVDVRTNPLAHQRWFASRSQQQTQKQEVKDDRNLFNPHSDVEEVEYRKMKKPELELNMNERLPAQWEDIVTATNARPVGRSSVASLLNSYHNDFKFYGEMEMIPEVQAAYKLLQKEGVTPTILTFNLLIDAYSNRYRGKDMTPIDDLRMDMEAYRILPNEDTFRILLKIYKKYGLMDRYDETIQEIRSYDLDPESFVREMEEGKQRSKQVFQS